MSDNGFKDYIENRTLDDIMAAYDEQRDEWETLLIIENDEVRKFRHSNGKDFFCQQYNPQDEEYVVNEKMKEILSGKTVEEQMEHFFVTNSIRLYSTAYGEITKDNLRENAVKLCDYDRVTELLLKGKILVGAKIKSHWGEGFLLPEKRVCTYYACDNEGSGTKECEDYAYLIFAE